MKFIVPTSQYQKPTISDKIYTGKGIHKQINEQVDKLIKKK